MRIEGNWEEKVQKPHLNRISDWPLCLSLLKVREGREETLWSLLATEREQSQAAQSAEPDWASGVSGLRGQGLLAVGDIKPSD